MNIQFAGIRLSALRAQKNLPGHQKQDLKAGHFQTRENSTSNHKFTWSSFTKTSWNIWFRTIREEAQLARRKNHALGQQTVPHERITHKPQALFNLCVPNKYKDRFPIVGSVHNPRGSQKWNNYINQARVHLIHLIKEKERPATTGQIPMDPILQVLLERNTEQKTGTLFSVFLKKINLNLILN